MKDDIRRRVSRRSFALLAAATAMLQSAATYAADRLLDMVNPLQGTESHGGFSHGATLPLVGPPWPMTHWAPQTGWSRTLFETGGWWFQSTGDKIYGLRATRQPSPWMGDYGFFTILPTTPDAPLNYGDRASPYDRTASTFRPDYLKLRLDRYNVTTELTASERCAVMRFNYEQGDTGRIFFDPARVSHIEIDGRTIRGYSTQSNGGTPKDFKAYFVARLDRDITASGTYDEKFKQSAGSKTVDGDRIGAYVDVSLTDGRTVNLAVATSYISYDQAEQNLKAETDGGFDATRSRTTNAWEANLGRAKVSGGTEEQRRTFYSCLYRSQTFPHRLHEISADGNKIHFSMYDGRLHDGPAYGDIGFWDVHRTNFSLWSLLYPEQLGEILDGFVISSKESGGWLPQWPSPGMRGGMIGTHTDPVYADAIAKNIQGFDREAAYAAIRKNAFDQPRGVPAGRGPLQDYVKLGYVPAKKDGGYTVSETLDFAYDDWGVAQVAKALGKTDDYDALMKRSKNYKNLWDPSTGFFRPKKPDGSWLTENFDEFAWATGFCEGGPWQGTWAVPHDVDGMVELMGGKQKMAAKLDQMMGLPPLFHVGEYGKEIHEMSELAAVNFGQYAHGNQPVHHVLYLYTAIGQPHKTQYWTRRVCQELYNSGPAGFAGDEDNGEMSSWFVLSSMGLFQLCVGDPNYTLTSPLFDQVRLSLPGGKELVISTENNAPTHHYAKQVALDGQTLTAPTVPFSRLVQGGELKVQLAPRPAEKP